MSVRRSAGLAVDAAALLIGRRQVVRAARFVLNRARYDVPNRPAGNGEFALQRWLLAGAVPGMPLTVLDVGANVGDWSVALLEQARRMGRHDVSLHAFEPSEYTCALLRARLPDSALVSQVAVSATVGQATLHVVGAGSGTNSMYRPDGDVTAGAETVNTTTIDGYLRLAGIAAVDLLKIDAEGHDFAVLAGAEQALRRKAIGIVQFEYNHRWVHARHYLRDVFDLVEPLGYRVAKLTPRGVEAYPGWDPELETFIEGNYVAYTGEIGARLPVIAWWKVPR